MAANIKSNSKCDQCQTPAQKRASFGLLISDALAERGRISEMQYTARQLNLCEKHLIEKSAQYVHFSQHDIAEGSTI